MSVRENSVQAYHEGIKNGDLVKLRAKVHKFIDLFGPCTRKRN